MSEVHVKTHRKAFEAERKYESKRKQSQRISQPWKPAERTANRITIPTEEPTGKNWIEILGTVRLSVCACYNVKTKAALDQ